MKKLGTSISAIEKHDNRVYFYFWVFMRRLRKEEESERIRLITGQNSAYHIIIYSSIEFEENIHIFKKKKSKYRRFGSLQTINTDMFLFSKNDEVTGLEKGFIKSQKMLNVE